MDEKYQMVKQRLEAYGQAHLLQFYDTLKKEEQDALLSQLEHINLEQMKKIYQQSKEELDFNGSKIEPMEYLNKEGIEKQKLEVYKKKGTDAVKAGKLAVVTMAGGQGTRLGHKGPKGTYMLNLREEGKKSIFEILTQNLREASEKYQTRVPWYIMTSKENNDETVAFFEKNNYFGYGKENIQFFKQGELPMLSEDGKILLEEKGKIKEAADGHGGVFEAMHKNDIVKEMKQKGIEWIYVGGVDNILAEMVDPVYLGTAIDRDVMVAGKSVPKKEPQEKVGVFCKKDGRPGIIEYIEISDELKNERDQNGNLVYGQANIVNHLFNMKALDMVNDKKLPYHIAHKKADYINEKGEKIEATEPNAIKTETFMFDILQYFEPNQVLLMQVSRENEFSAIKNSDEAEKDCPKIATKDYLEKRKRQQLKETIKQKAKEEMER